MSYQFLPWVRSGAATAYTNADGLGPVLKRTDGKPLTDLPVALRVNTTPVDVPLRLYGPGDVTGIDQRVVIRVDPPGGSADLEPNYLACVEFDTPDFPWMLTPASAGSNARLRPWLVLAVVRRTELRFSADKPLPVLSVVVAELPDLLDSWIWAHAQVVQGDVADPIDQLLTAHPQRNLSRLVCPRRLEPFTAYTACLVPAFEVGRLAGLGEEVTPAAENALAAAWDATKTQVELPVYFHWEFATGAGGDFETLADRLTGRKAGSAGRRPLNADDQPFGVGDPGRTLEFQGPLVAAETPEAPLADQPFRDRLDELLKLDGVVTPPVYGSHQAGPLRANGPAWMRELNLDPAARAAAGLGARIVQERQEQLVTAAWQQLGDVQAVARLERRLELAVAVLGSVKRRHIEPLDAGRLVQLVGPAYARMPGATKTLRASLVSSGLPASFSSAPLRRALRPAGSLARRRSPAPQPQLQLVANQVAAAVPAVGPAAGTQGLVAAAHVTAQLGRMGGFETPQQTRYRHAITQVRNYLDAVAGAPAPQPSAPMALTRGVWQTVVDGLDPAVTLPRRFYSRVTSAGERVARPEITGPSFPQPMYEALRDLSPELLLPGVGKILPDTVTVLASNTRTIEAFMAGLNQEFAAELLWREFPGDLRHTSFRHFWDGAPAMPAIHEWSAGLGDHFAAGNEQLVLLIRGELLRRYPDALIYAVNAVGPTTLGTVQKLPVFRGRIDPDITFLGFDLVGDDWFFVIEEQPSAPRFGMDEVRDKAFDDWNRLAWSDMRTLPGAQLKMADIKPNTRPPGPTWAFNSAHMAAILRQRPVRVAFHAERLLP